jgi:hypothetical protein
MRNVLEKFIERIKTHIFCPTFFLKNLVIYEIMPKSSLEPEGVTNDVTIWRMRVACWISKATCTQAHTHAYESGKTHARKHAHIEKYVIIIAFPRHK